MSLSPSSDTSIAEPRSRGRVGWRLALAALGLAILACVPPALRWSDPGRTREGFNFPAFAAAAPDGGLTVVDQSRRRVLRLDARGELRFVLRGGERGSGRIFYAQEAVVGDGDVLFVHSYALDEYGYFLEREEIQAYGPDGRFRRVLHAVDLGGAERGGLRMGLRPLSRALTPRPGGGVDWLELEAGGLRAWHAPADGPAAAGALYPCPDAQMDVAEAAFRAAPGGRTEVVFTDKAGRIRRVGPDGPAETLYDADADAKVRGRRTPDGVPSIPWGVAADPSGRIVYTDVVFRELRRLAPDAAGEPETLWSTRELRSASAEFRQDVAERGLQPEAVYFPRVWAGPDGAVVACSENVVATLPDGDGSRADIRGGFGLPRRDREWALASWIGTALAAAGIALALRGFVRSGWWRGLPREIPQAAGLLLVMTLTLAATLPVVVSRLTERENEIYRQQLRQVLHTVPRLLDGDRFARLNDAGDYYGEDYRALRRQVDEIFLAPDSDWNRGGYCAVYRFRDGRIYACLYQNGEVGLYYPYAWDDVEIYRAAAEDGETTVFESRDATGDWILGVTPLRDGEGRIVAVFEMGTDRHVRSMATRALVRAALMDAVTLLVVLALSMFEFVFAANLLRAARRFGGAPGAPRRRAGDETRTSPFFAVRPLVGLFFLAWSFPAVFTTLRMQELYDPAAWPWFSRDVALAIPLSAQMLAFALAVNGGVRLIAWIGARRTIHLGFLVAGLGLLAGGLADAMGEFTFACVVAGAGGGLGFIAIRALLSREPDDGMRDAGFSHFYSGLTAGSYVGLGIGSALAGYCGYRNTFLLAAAAMAVAWIVARVLMMPAFPRGEDRARLSAGLGGGLGGIARFLLRPPVAAFCLCHLLPVFTLGAFISWYFPVFAEGEGMPVGDIGRVMLLYGLVVIYWGPWATARFLPKFGSWRLMMGVHTLWCLSIVVFAIWPTLAGACAALAAFAVLEGLGVAGENSYLMRLAKDAGFPEERAAALYETGGKLGETAGPVIFAMAFALGPTRGMLALGAAGLAGLLVLAAFRPRKPG